MLGFFLKYDDIRKHDSCKYCVIVLLEMGMTSRSYDYNT